MKSRLRQFLGLRYAPLRCISHDLLAVARCRAYFLAAAKTMFWPGATPHFEGRSRPTLLRCCILARSIPSYRFCRRRCEDPDEESSKTARTMRGGRDLIREATKTFIGEPFDSLY